MLPIFSRFDYERIRAEKERDLQQARLRKLARESRRGRETQTFRIRISRLGDSIQMFVRLHLPRPTVQEPLQVPCADCRCLELARVRE
jgi:hypothetical protein